MISPVVATINSADGRTAIWYTDCGVDSDLTRLCGAWVDLTDEQTEHVLAQRTLLSFPDTPIPELSTEITVLDPNATRAAVLAEIDRLDALHRQSLTAAGNPRAAINWPTVPDELDFADLPAVPPGVSTDPLIADTIAVARWLENLADAWAAVETHRTSREHLREGQPRLRPFPAVTRP